MTCGVYKITNTINGKCYIGQSENIESRWKSHRTNAKSKPTNPEYNYPLYRAFRKYGLDAFTFEVLLECSRDLLLSEEARCIKDFNSDNPKYGYNCKTKHVLKRIPEAQIKEIMFLLGNTALSISEIATLYKITSKTVCMINQGDTRKQDNIVYPIREVVLAKQLTSMLHISRGSRFYEAVPDIKFRKEHNIIETITKFNEQAEKIKENFTWSSKRETKKNSAQRVYSLDYSCIQCGNPCSGPNSLCLDCYNKKRQEETMIPEDEVGFDLIERILDTSMEKVAKEYGYSAGAGLKRHLAKHGFPTTVSGMREYYEKEVGVPHEKQSRKLMNEQIKRENKARTRSRTIGQYEYSTGELVQIFPGSKEASRKTGISNGSIVDCCNGRLNRTSDCFWRYLNNELEPIDPMDVVDYQWNSSCDVCNKDTGSVDALLCPTCESNRKRVKEKEQTLELLLEMLDVYPFAQLAKLCQTDQKTLMKRFERLGMSEKEVRDLNRENNEKRK